MRQRDIPKQYRIPRPMAAPGRREHPFWQIVPIEAFAVATGALVALASPLAGIDDALKGTIVRLAASERPPETAIAVHLTPADVRSGGCDRALRIALEKGGARAALLFHDARELCPAHELESDRATAPVAWLPRAAVRIDGQGRVVGFREPPADVRAGLERVGVRPAEWVAAQSGHSVPAVALSDLTAGHVPASVLAGKLALVGVSRQEPDAAELEPLVARVAGALGASLEDAPRRSAPSWLTAFIALLSAVGAAFGYSRRGPRAALGLLVGLPFALLGLQVAYTLLGGSVLLPLATIALSLGACVSTLILPRAVAKQRALTRATELLERAALIRAQSIHTIPDQEFFMRVAKLAAQAHPADEVLIAELPPHRWHLKFWPNGSAGENMIGERRRDIRRTPYSSEEGVPTIRLVRNYLVMKDVPVVVVPLIAFGDIEGYVFLCGARAEVAFNENPDLAQHLSRDLGTLLYRRRLGSLHEDDWRRTAGALVRQPERRSATLIEGARIALDDLRLFGAVLREAPVPLLYADSFADVRMLGKEFARYLPAFGIEVPAGAGEGPLGAGALPLSRVLSALVESPGSAVSLTAVAESPQGLKLGTRSIELDGVQRRFELSVRPLLHESAGIPSVIGYVASLEEIRESAALAVVERLPVSARGSADPLVVVRAGELIQEIAFAASRASGRAIRYEPPRTDASVLVHRRAVTAAFEKFLVDAAEHAAGGSSPVLALTERRQRLRIHVLDLKLGLPASMLERVLSAPTAPPEGLESFGRLVTAIEHSHGGVGLKSSGGWGVVLSVDLVRACAPAVSTGPASVGEVVELARHQR